MLAASPRRNPRLPFRRTTFPRGGSERSSTSNAAGRAAVPAGAPGGPWWKALIDALAAPPRANAAHRGKNATPDADRESRSLRRPAPNDAEPSATSPETWRPVTERLDRQREQLAGINEHLRRLVELRTSERDGTAVYAPPG